MHCRCCRATRNSLPARRSSSPVVRRMCALEREERDDDRSAPPRCFACRLVPRSSTTLHLPTAPKSAHRDARPTTARSPSGDSSLYRDRHQPVSRLSARSRKPHSTGRRCQPMSDFMKDINRRSSVCSAAGAAAAASLAGTCQSRRRSLVAATFPGSWENAYRRVLTPLVSAGGPRPHHRSRSWRRTNWPR